jgi:trehalose 6-phosphate phosphatase
VRSPSSPAAHCLSSQRCCQSPCRWPAIKARRCAARRPPPPPPQWRRAAEDFAAAHPGALVEPKAHGFVLHYRQAPAAEAPARALLQALLAPDGAFELLPARMAFEVKPRAVSKAGAVTGLMAQRPFAGRRPIYVGDDVTDEAGMAAARAAGGLGLRLQDSFGTPAALRDWRARLDAAA